MGCPTSSTGAKEDEAARAPQASRSASIAVQWEHGPAGCLGREAGVALVRGERPSAARRGWPWRLVPILSLHRRAWYDSHCSSLNICLLAGGRRGDSHIYAPAGSRRCRAGMRLLEQIPGGAWHSPSSACGDIEAVRITMLGPASMQEVLPAWDGAIPRAMEDCRSVALPQSECLCPSQ